MESLPRTWLIVLLSVILVVGILVWFFWPKSSVKIDGMATPVTDENWPTSQPSDALITAQLHFTFTVPTGWVVRSWPQSEFQRSGQTLSSEVPRLRQSIDRWLAAFQAESQVLLVQPIEEKPGSQSAILFQHCSARLAPEQIAATLAEKAPLDHLIDTELRQDGQPNFAHPRQSAHWVRIALLHVLPKSP
ncbi:MAG: hypothetical protein U0175_07045 [Caldilineaceae bacterium]